MCWIYHTVIQPWCKRNQNQIKEHVPCCKKKEWKYKICKKKNQKTGHEICQGDRQLLLGSSWAISRWRNQRVMEGPHISTSLEYESCENDFLLSINYSVIYYEMTFCIESNQKISSHMIVNIKPYKDLCLY